MWPTLYEFSNGNITFPVNTYGLVVLLAFVLAFGYGIMMFNRVGVRVERTAGLLVGAAVGGMIGARLLYAVAVEPATFLRPWTLFSTGGFAYYGGVIGGTIGVFAVSWIQKLPGWKVADIAAPALVLGLGVGRLACFFAGCCHGARAPITNRAVPLLGEGTLQGQIWLDSVFPYLTLEFHGGVGRVLDVPLYPTQLWSAAAGIGIFALLAGLWYKRRFDGQIGALMLIVEPVFRFIIEAFRADHRGYAIAWETTASWAAWLPGQGLAGAASDPDAVIVGLTTSQAIGLAMMVGGVVVMALRWNAGVAPEVSVEDQDLGDAEE